MNFSKNTIGKYFQINNIIIILFFSSLFLISNPVFAWKPTTHVYLVQQALGEVEFDTTNDKWMVPIYEVDYLGQIKSNNRIGTYEADQDLVDLLFSQTDALNNGIIGPDGYPDLPTGQTRIHPSCSKIDEETKLITKTCPIPEHFEFDPRIQGKHLNDESIHPDRLISNHWLQHVWNQAQVNVFGENIESNKAFAFGYLTHAAGDMFMHTFVNKFAGGEFDALSDNGLRHYLIESYVGKRTEDLDSYVLDFSDELSNFVYRTLVDANPASRLHTDLMVEFPLGHSLENFPSTFSIPRHFSSLKNNLKTVVIGYETQLATLNAEIRVITDELSDCISKGLDTNFFNDCSPIRVVNLAIAEGGKIVQKDGLVLSVGIFVAYARNWIDNIETGLKAWPVFSHKVAQNMLFNKNGMDRDKLVRDWEDYRNQYFLDMIGVPSVVGAVLTGIDSIKDDFYTEETREQIQLIKDSFYNSVLLTISGGNLSLEDLDRYLRNPELYFDQTLGSMIGVNGNVPEPITLARINQLLKIDDTGFTLNAENDHLRFDADKFAPAHNTKTMVKLMLMSEAGLRNLYQDLACPNLQNCGAELAPVSDNIMLGFIRSLDADNEWKNPDFQMGFAECSLYQQIFMSQNGELDATLEDENCISNGEQSLALEKLDVPEIFPNATEFDDPFEVIMSHSESDVRIYYSLSDVDIPRIPSDNLNDSFSYLYSAPFMQFAPFTEVRPLVLRAIAYKEGFLPSDVVEYTFIISAQKAGPTFFPTLLDHLGSVNITLTPPDPTFTIYYTLNGTKPSYLDSRYVNGITLNVGQYEIRAIAYKIGYPATEISTRQYNVWSGNGDNVEIPIFAPFGSANVTSELDVSIRTETQSAEIYYTIGDGVLPAEPTINDIKYSTPFTLNVGQWFILAKAFDPNGLLGPSVTKQIVFTVWEAVGETDLPVITPNGGTFFNSIKINISGETTPDNAGSPQVFYEVDGSTPYANPLIAGRNKTPTLFKPVTLKVQAIQKFFNPSPVATAKFDFYAADPIFQPVSGEYDDSVEITLTSETNNAKIYYTLDGSEPDRESFLYETPITITDSLTVKSKAFFGSFYDSNTVNGNYRIKVRTAPVISLQPESATIYVGQSSVLATDATGYPAPTFQWYKDDVVLVDKTTRTLRLNNVSLDDAASYHVEVINIVGTVVSDSAIVNVAALPFPPEISQQPQPVEINKGQELRLSVTVKDTTQELTYQWYRDDSLLTNQAKESLVIQSADRLHAGIYKVVISNIGGSTQSDTATVSVIDNNEIQRPDNYPYPPEVLLQPVSIEIKEGESISLLVAVNALPEASYIWLHEQTMLADQTTSNLKIDNAALESAGNYRVIIRNNVGTVVSDVAVVSVEKLDGTVTNSPVDTNEAAPTKSKKSGSGASNQYLLLILLVIFLITRNRTAFRKNDNN